MRVGQSGGSGGGGGLAAKEGWRCGWVSRVGGGGSEGGVAVRVGQSGDGGGGGGQSLSQWISRGRR